MLPSFFNLPNKTEVNEGFGSDNRKLDSHTLKKTQIRNIILSWLPKISFLILDGCLLYLLYETADLKFSEQKHILDLKDNLTDFCSQRRDLLMKALWSGQDSLACLWWLLSSLEFLVIL